MQIAKLLEALAFLDLALSLTHSVSQSLTHVYENSRLIDPSRPSKILPDLPDHTRSFKILQDTTRSAKIFYFPS